MRTFDVLKKSASRNNLIKANTYERLCARIDKRYESTRAECKRPHGLARSIMDRCASDINADSSAGFRRVGKRKKKRSCKLMQENAKRRNQKALKNSLYSEFEQALTYSLNYIAGAIVNRQLYRGPI